MKREKYFPPEHATGQFHCPHCGVYAKQFWANIVANELGVNMKTTSGPVLDKPGDLAGLLTNLETNDVLFIDEIHRLSPIVEEYLSKITDYRVDAFTALNTAFIDDGAFVFIPQNVILEKPVQQFKLPIE